MEDYKKFRTEFQNWPLDKQCDYILDVYHKNIRTKGPEIQALIDNVCRTEGQEHPSLYEVQELFQVSMLDLAHHLMKEEQILFPYIYALWNAKLADSPAPRFHCGSIANPIEVMKIEHEAETVRYRHIDDLTGGYSAPEDANSAYRQLMHDLREFNESLLEHIDLENNIVFPAAIQLSDMLGTY